MKKFWKVLGLTALAAALVPYRIEGDDETGTLTVRALLWKATEKVKADGTKDLSIKLLSFGPDEEENLFTDDPEEAVLFADDEPEAAVITAENTVPAPEEKAAPEEEAGEEDFDPEL